jgi:hypothetical protein
LLLLFLNHTLEELVGHDVCVIDVCIGLGYLLFIVL